MNQEQSFRDVMFMGSVTTEEGTIVGRNTQFFDLPESIGAAKVNGPIGNKGQYLWMGTYTVRLDRGLSMPGVQHICGLGGNGSQDMRCLAINERVTITWVNKNNIQIPIIIDGDTFDYYSKIVTGGTLLDPGERIIRAGIAANPGTSGEFPFADNQFDTASVTPESGIQNEDKHVSKQGSETFYDKFGRILNISRTNGFEFLTTTGKVDTGQDDVSTLETISDQDTYYAKILNDESEPILKSEPFAPKPLNLVQYQLKPVVCKIEGDPDKNRTVLRGVLPRFDKWKFNPIIIRKYGEDVDGIKETTTSYSTFQERSNSSADGTTLGYLRTVTNTGDVKEFVPRHYNGRVVKDYLLSVGGNYDFRVKTTAMKPDGTENMINLSHQEFLADGTVRLKVNEDTSAKTATFGSTISTSVGQVIFLKDGGGTESDYNLKITYGIDGTITIDTKKDINITATGTGTISIDGDVSLTTKGNTTLNTVNCDVTASGDCTISADGNISVVTTDCDIVASGDCNVTADGVCNVDGSTVNLGKNAAKMLIDNIPACLFTGAPHYIGNSNVKA